MAKMGIITTKLEFLLVFDSITNLIDQNKLNLIGPA